MKKRAGRNPASSEQARREGDARLPLALRGRGIIIALCDTDLRYVWMHGAHPDFDARLVRGRRDTELADNAGTRRLEQLKRMVIESGASNREEIVFPFVDGTRTYDIQADPVRDGSGRVMAVATVAVDITARTQREAGPALRKATPEEEIAGGAQVLRGTDARLRTLLRAVEQNPASIIITNTAGEIEYVNPKFSEVTGYAIEEVLGRNPRLLKSGHQDAAFYREMWETIKAGRDWRGEFCNRRKNGDEFWEYAVIAPIHDEDGILTHFVAIKEDVTRRRRLEADLLRISEREQNRIGMDLHDGLGPQIAAIAILNDALLGSLRAKELPEAAAATRLKELLQGASEQMRGIARGLLPVGADPDGLMVGLETFLRSLADDESCGARLAFVCPDPVVVHDESVATHLFRITQEAVHNAVRHAAPRNITVRLTAGKGRITIEVADDGIGTNVADFKGNGLGLRTMRYRASALGGSLEIHHPPRGGTVVLCSISTPSTSAQVREDVQRPAASSAEVEHRPDR